MTQVSAALRSHRRLPNVAGMSAGVEIEIREMACNYWLSGGRLCDFCHHSHRIGRGCAADLPLTALSGHNKIAAAFG